MHTRLKARPCQYDKLLMLILIGMTAAATRQSARATPLPVIPAETPQTADQAAGQHIQPRLLQALEQFIDSLQETQKMRGAQALEESLDDLRFLYHEILPEEAFTKLERSAQEALEEASTRWRTHALEVITTPYQGKQLPLSTVDSLIMSLQQAAEYPDQLPQAFRIAPDIKPLQTRVWKNILAGYLDEQQLALLEKNIALDRNLLVQRYGPQINASAERLRGEISHKIRTDLLEIKSALELDEARLEKLQPKVQTLIENAVDELKERHLDAIAAASRDQRREFLRNGTFNVSTSEVTDPAETKAWRRILDETLSTEEQLEWKSFRIDRRAKAIETGARLMVTALDEILFLSSHQREAMIDVLKKPAEQLLLSSLTEANSHFRIDAREILFFTKTADQKRFREILLDWQLAHWDQQLIELQHRMHQPWEEQSAPPLARHFSPSRRSISPQQDRQIVEEAITEHVLTTIAPRVALYQTRYNALAETTAAVSGLDERGRNILKIAACGATELERQELIRRCDSLVRQHSRGADATSIDRSIAGLKGIVLHASPSPEAARLWQQTLSWLLDDRQRQANDAFRSAQIRFRCDTLGHVNAHRLGVNCRLTAAQVEQLATEVGRQLFQHAPDIDEVFKRLGPEDQWYLRHHNLIGLHMIAEEQFKEIAGQQAYHTWAMELKPATEGWWQQLREHRRLRMHQQEGHAEDNENQPGMDPAPGHHDSIR
jgi:hypothetical protein